MRGDVDEAEIDPVVTHRPRQRLEPLQPPDTQDPATQRRPTHHHLQRQPPRHAHVAPGLRRQPGEGHRHLLRSHLAQRKELLQVAERHHRVQLVDPARCPGPHIDDRQLRPQQMTQESRLCHAGIGHRRQVGHQLRVMGRDRRHHHRVGAPDQGAPVGVLPLPLVLLGYQLVAHDSPGDMPESGLIAGIDQLFWCCRMEPRRRLGRQDQRPGPRLGNRHRTFNRPRGRDRLVGAGGNALAAADAVLLHHLHDPRLRRQRDGVRGAHPDTREARDATRWINGELQLGAPSGRRAPIHADASWGTP